MSGEESVGLMRNLGQFVGHVVSGFRSDPRAVRSARVDRIEMHRATEERRGADGVILRRTVIDEVELPADRATHGAGERGAAEKDDHAS